MMIVKTKLTCLNEEFILKIERNPIENIKSRLKTSESIMEKLKKRGHSFTIENIEKYIFDIAGLRVICNFPEDVYLINDALFKQDDIKILLIKDYIKKPKESGYRSLHLIAEIPIYLLNEKKEVKVEIQLRTIAMNFWATLEHELRYKKEFPKRNDLILELKECAEQSALLDLRMEKIKKILDRYKV